MNVREALAPLLRQTGERPVLTMLSLDPGKTTGYCIAVYDDKLRICVGQEELSLGAVSALLEKLASAGQMIDLHVIYEDFEYRNQARTGLDLTPVKIIGVIEMYKEFHEPFISFYKQSAATGKAFYSDDRLKQLGVYKIGKPHGRDATRHLLQWANFGAGGRYIDLETVQLELVDMEWMIDRFGDTVME